MGYRFQLVFLRTENTEDTKDKRLLKCFSRSKLCAVTTRIIKNSRKTTHENKKDHEKVVVLYVFVDTASFSLVVFVVLLSILEYPRLKMLEICWERIVSFFSRLADPLCMEYLNYYIGQRTTIILYHRIQHTLLGNWIPGFKALLLGMFNYLYKVVWQTHKILCLSD